MKVICLVVLLAVQLAAGGVIDDLKNKLASLKNGIDQQVQDLEDKVSQIIPNLEQTVGKQLDDQITSIISKAQDSIEQQIKGISEAGPAVSACLDAAKADFVNIGDSVKSQFNTFIIREGLKILPVVGKVNTTINNGKALVTKIGTDGKSCIDQGGLKAVTCISALIVSVPGSALSYAGEVGTALGLISDTTETVLQDGTNYVSDVVSSVTSQTATIVNTAVSCVKGAVGL